jgi:hypothetical protein
MNAMLIKQTLPSDDDPEIARFAQFALRSQPNATMIPGSSWLG